MKALARATMVLLVSGVALAEGEDPCGGVQFTAGRILTKHIITPENVSSPETDACLQQVAAQVKARRTVRSVTVAARVPDAERPAGTALPLAELVTSKLVTAGVPKKMVSSVAPRTEAVETNTVVQLNYIERPPETPVARVMLVDGDVKVGDEQKPAERGVDLRLGEVIKTEAGAVVVLNVADGTRLRILEGTTLSLESLSMDVKKVRKAVVKLERGTLEADIPAAEKGSEFKFQTPKGAVDGDGGTFRLHADDNGTRVEVLEGQVELKGKRELKVNAHHASQLDANSKPQHAKPLLTAPRAKGPLFGNAESPPVLKFDAVEGAAHYRVELSRNASFSDDVKTVQSDTTEVPLPEGSQGKWYWRVYALDADGYAGESSRIHAFSVPKSG